MRSLLHPSFSRATARILASRVSSKAIPRTLLASRSAALTAKPDFHVQYRSFSAATDSLIDMLKREYDEEIENQTTTMPDDLKDLQKTIQDKQWKIVDEGASVRLISNSGTKKVQILFHCQDTVDDLGYDEENENEEEEAPAFRFTVTVTKAGKSMVFQCYTKYGQTNIETVGISKKDLSELDDGIPATEYQGPEFAELAVDLQEAFKDYLWEELGIDEDMNVFISMYADYKEQGQYVEFLESAKSLLS